MNGSLDIYDLPISRPRPGVAVCDRKPAKRFLMIWFRCCHAYGRLYRNSTNTAFEGRCPACGAAVQARIGPDGSAARMFEAS